MKLKLTRPIIFFDIEATGLNISTDRIVELCLIKIYPNGNEETQTLRFNPGIPISPEATAVNGIHDEDVAECPFFKEKAKDIAHLMEGCDIAGFNSNFFDIPLLAEEFIRAGVDFDLSKCKFIDVQNIYHKMEKRTNPRDVNACYGTVGPTQESVDMFFTKNGLTIEEDPEYSENSLVTVYNPTYNENEGKDDNNIFSMYSNREPRFYADVMYQGKSWFNKNFNNAHPGYFVDFSLHGGAGPDSKDTPLVGYMLAKFKNRTVNHASGDIQSFKRVSIIYRLAEFYLFYAEVLNELDPTDSRIIEYIDYVRKRAGIPTYEELEREGIKTIRGDYDKQFDAIQRERFVELFCEGQRYFDIRRWMICGPGQAADQTRFSGMNEYGTTDVAIGQMGSFYNRTVLENRLWDNKMYLYPIHHNVVTLSQGLIPQNPGW